MHVHLHALLHVHAIVDVIAATEQTRGMTS
ncbi:hypothetical protein SAMN05443668_110216 [Cryptosporangium aurantiacum]|uniref:Uncharacterized protein n=1 Tax=Cryptosporangium aurantiacum TaxID=134849 RepID=A0A1M7RDS1_9ACTN|nr:hypothetical protein SAMN05443668_110216 [Cryptosporangium aurantiacum]